jgi:hypothetical protein
MSREKFVKKPKFWRDRCGFIRHDDAKSLGISARILRNRETARSMPRGLGLNALLVLTDEKVKCR